MLNGGGLRPVFQPVIDLRNGEVLAFEGLTRLPEGAPFRDPGVLFEAAEAAGRTYELDLACITSILNGARTIDRRIGLSLNLSPRTLETPEFAPEPFVARLSMAGWEPQRIIIELTERDAVQDIDRLRRVLDRLRATGLRIAADDVGAGNAGLRLLSQIHFDIVKLDLALVQDGARRGTSLDVVRSIADLAARWGAMVIAEGLETPAQLRLIRSLPIAAAQGYLLGRPATVPDAAFDRPRRPRVRCHGASGRLDHAGDRRVRAPRGAPAGGQEVRVASAHPRPAPRARRPASPRPAPSRCHVRTGALRSGSRAQHLAVYERSCCRTDRRRTFLPSP